jgi:hypothetical protein
MPRIRQWIDAKADAISPALTFDIPGDKLTPEEGQSDKI